MSLTTDADYLIHGMRIKFLRIDERAERIISFRPTVMSDEYIRLAAPVYPEMQYCYSPVQETTLQQNQFPTAVLSSPRTKRSQYHLRKREIESNPPVAHQSTRFVHNPNDQASDSSDDEEEEEIQVELKSRHKLDTTNKPLPSWPQPIQDNDTVKQDQTILGPKDNRLPSDASLGFSFHGNGSEQANTLSLDPSVDSVLDSSSRSLSPSSAPRLVFPIVPPTTTSQSGVISRTGSTTPTQSTEGIVGIQGDKDNGFKDKDSTALAQASQDTPSQIIQQISPLQYTKRILNHTSSLEPSNRPKISALSAMIAEKASVADNPFAEYAFVDGKGENHPVKLCVYLPHSSTPFKPVQLVVRPDAIIDDVIGFILYDYIEHKRTPEIAEEQYDLAQWSLLMAEDDGEVEDYLPALDRMSKIDRVSFDQFALCRATPSQIIDNEMNRAKLGRGKPDIESLRKNKQPVPSIIVPPSTHSGVLDVPASNRHDQSTLAQSTANSADPLVGPPSTVESSTNYPHLNLQPQLQLLQVPSQQTETDSSAVAVPIPSSKAVLTKSTMPMTPIKYFRIRLMTNEAVSATTMIGVDEEMFIGDVLDLVSRKRKLDPEEYMLTIADTNMIVPNDTPVEGLPSETDLCLTKKGTSLTVPTSANHLWRSPIKKKKEDSQQPMYFSTANSPNANSNNNNNNNNGATDNILSQYKKYIVNRKMPMFVGKRASVLAIDGDYIHLMPPEHKGMFDSVKTTSFHVSAIRTCKASKKLPSHFKIVVMKERDYKTYALEAESAKEAYDICSRIKFLIQVTKGT